MSEEQKMDWALYFSTLSKPLLEEISRHLQNELYARYNEKDANKAVNSKELHLALSGAKIEAIKAYRDRTGCGLYESKIAIEAVMKMKML